MNEENIFIEPQAMARGLRDLWAVILKRKWTVISFVLVVVAMVTIASLSQKPIYISKGMLLVEREPNILNFDDIFRLENFNTDYFQTQLKILQSRSLADSVMKRMNLYENERFVDKLKRKAGLSDQSGPFLRERLIDKFLSRLSVKHIGSTRLVEVSFKDSNPQFAANIINVVFDAFIDMNIQRKFLATEQATEFLANQINIVGTELEEKEKKFQEYGVEKNIITLSNEETTIVKQLGDLNQALSDAQIDRIQKQAYYEEIKLANPNYIPKGLNSELIQKLREDYAALNQEYNKKLETYKPDFPEMQRLKADIDATGESLNNEAQNLIQTAYADYQAALKKEKSLEAAFNRQRQEAVRLNSSSILYNSLKVEIQNKKSVLESLLKRKSETDVSAGLKGLGSNVSIIDKATAPLHPSSPKKKRNIILALMIGIFGGCGLAFLFEFMDDSVKNFHDIEKYCQLPALGLIPTLRADANSKHGGKKWTRKKGEGHQQGVLDLTGKNAKKPSAVESIELITHFLPKSKISENYRSIRTTLLYASADAKLGTLLVSSPLPEEGKTITVSNLAASFAQAGKTVLLIDSDLRKPRLHKIFNIKNLTGLTNSLNGNTDWKELIKETQIPNLYFINAGPVPPNPVELLGSTKMDDLLNSMKQLFEVIMLDTPPLLPVSDTLILGKKVDGIILVAWGGKTSREALKQAKERIDIHKIKCIGVIINNMKLEAYGDYYIRHYHHYYSY